MRVGVFGVSGFIGKALDASLKQSGHEVVGYGTQAGGIEAQSGDLSSDFALASGLDAVVYLSQSPFYRQVPERAPHLFQVNAVTAIKVANLARQGRVRRFIYFSTGSVYGPSFRPLSEADSVTTEGWYALSKLTAERALNLLRADLEVVVVRPFGVYGSGQRGMLVPNLLNAISDGKEISLDPNPENPNDTDGLKISLCHVDDAVKITSCLIESGGPAVVNLAGREAISIRRLAKALGDLAGREVRFKVGERPRKTDLIASTRLMDGVFGGSQVPLSAGLARVVEGSP